MSFFLRLISCLMVLSTAAMAAGEGEESTLKPNDIVLMEVFGQNDLTTSTRIMLSGEAVLPLIGSVELSGLTVADAIERIRGLYAAEYLVDPKVSLTVSEYASEFVSMIGSLNNPGQVPIPPSGNLDLATAVASAGGLSPTADREKIIVTSPDGVNRTYDAARVERGAPVPLRAGDRVIVHQSPFVNKTVTILGQVRKAGPVPMPMNGRLDIVTAIAQAGGFTELANPKKVSVNRGGKVTTLNVKEMTDQGESRYFLNPGDIITVAERWF